MNLTCVRRRFLLPIATVSVAILSGPGEVTASETRSKSESDAAGDDVVSMVAYNVKADRIEDFGLRVGEAPIVFVAFVPRPESPYIEAVLPNTAASKAGLEPGERILKSDGRSTAMTAFSSGKWRKILAAKNAEAAAGKTVKWELEVTRRGTKEVRTVTLTLPTSPPRWGSSAWRAPDGRKASIVTEAGPLSETSRMVLDHGVWASIDSMFLTGAGYWPTGYRWEIGGGREALHRVTVAQVEGFTRILIELNSRETGRWVYLTSPSGVLEKAWHFTRKKKGEVPIEEARVGFKYEQDLWTTKVGKVSARWPFELKPGYDADEVLKVLAANNGGHAATAPTRALAAEFLKLPSATDAQRALFTDAFEKLGAESDCWAYTETSRGLDGKRTLVTRVDPSKPEAERCILLSIDGQPPKPDEVQRWRDEGGDTPNVFGGFPPLEQLVDLSELRIRYSNTESVTFETSIRGDSAEFPAEHFEALFRVNKIRRGFEDITIKTREAFRVAGVAKVTNAGMNLRFQTLDPAHPPQPVLLKGGGTARILLLKVGRSIEATRTEFHRVEPNAGSPE